MRLESRDPAPRIRPLPGGAECSLDGQEGARARRRKNLFSSVCLAMRLAPRLARSRRSSRGLGMGNRTDLGGRAGRALHSGWRQHVSESDRAERLLCRRGGKFQNSNGESILGMRGTDDDDQRSRQNERCERPSVPAVSDRHLD